VAARQQRRRCVGHPQRARRQLDRQEASNVVAMTATNATVATGRYTIALVVGGDDGQAGVVNLTRAEVLKVLPQLQSFAEHGQDPD
jgi:hypothetical protein